MKTILGKKVKYRNTYYPDFLTALPRNEKRDKISKNIKFPFKGVDRFNIYEISFLNSNKKPECYIGVLQYSSESPNMVESKSLKLYFNSYHMEVIEKEHFIDQVIEDLEEIIQDKVHFKLYPLHTIEFYKFKKLGSKNIDNINLKDENYFKFVKNFKFDIEYSKSGLKSLSINSNLLKSNCAVTGQPDFGTIEIKLTGLNIPTEESILRYILSFRNHNEFHEDIIDRIFYVLKNNFEPVSLLVQAFYTRRGGIDINPARVYNQKIPARIRVIRQ